MVEHVFGSHNSSGYRDRRLRFLKYFSDDYGMCLGKNNQNYSTGKGPNVGKS